MISIEWITLVAILVGPIAAVFVTRIIDARRENEHRRMEVFRTLMRTRRLPLSDDHVGALNLVEIEFQNYPLVIRAFKELFAHFRHEHARRSDELVNTDHSDEEVYFRNDRFDRRLRQERGNLLAKLLREIAKVLHFQIEQLDISEGGYLPQGRSDFDIQQAVIQRFLVDLALERRVLQISVIDGSQRTTPKDDQQSHNG